MKQKAEPEEDRIKILSGSVILCVIPVSEIEVPHTESETVIRDGFPFPSRRAYYFSRGAPECQALPQISPTL